VLDTTYIVVYYKGAIIKEIDFDWDIWNTQKNEVKHGVSRIEAESVFFDLDQVIFADRTHSTKAEKRLIIYAKSMENRVLMVGFTRRYGKIRVITARSASKKERKVYEEKKKERKS
jgi:uncharacterized DUF497 family protein